MNPLKVDILCTGLDAVRRGYESFARECFDNLRGDNRLRMRLYKGNGKAAPGERALWCIQRDSPSARLIGRVLKRSSYHVEQWSFLRSYLKVIKLEGEPDVIFTSDANLANFLFRQRQQSGSQYRILFSNGGPVQPPFPEYDHIQQVAEPYLHEAIDAGEPRARHSLVPYGIHISRNLRDGDFPDQASARAKLGLPASGRILLSVGYISNGHKRMDYLAREVAAIPKADRPFLLMLGQQDEASHPIFALCDEILGKGRWAAASCSHDQVGTYYSAADYFVLASLKEGFGRVFLEASSYGLQCIAHDHPVMRFVLGSEGLFSDMRESGTLCSVIQSYQKGIDGLKCRQRRVDDVANRFSWDALRESYVEMFQKASTSIIR